MSVNTTQDRSKEVDLTVEQARDLIEYSLGGQADHFVAALHDAQESVCSGDVNEAFVVIKVARG
jgi:hypothetical protein